MSRHTPNSSFPYRSGVSLNIQSHSPPHPFGVDYGNRSKIRKPVPGMRNVPLNTDRIEFALAHPPLTTTTPRKMRSDILTINEVIHNPQTGSSRSPLVRCHLASSHSRNYIAKIYDGVNYPLEFADCDCMYLADMDYSREATAYENIPSHLQGSSTPQYFGSWTFPLDTGRPGRKRWVRMILIEHIDGDALQDIVKRAMGSHTHSESSNDPLQGYESINYSLLPPDAERLDIIGRAIETEAALLHAGTLYNDFALRNIMLTRSNKRVVLVDFEQALVFRYVDPHSRPRRIPDPNKPPISPIVLYWGNNLCASGNFAGWFPQSWGESNRLHQRKWMCDRWGRCQEFELPRRFLEVNGKYLKRNGLLPHITAQFGDDWPESSSEEYSDD